MTTLSSVEITTRRRSARTLWYLLATAAVLLSLLFFYRQTIGRGAGRLFDFNIAYCASGVWLQGGDPYSRGDVLRHWEVIGGAHDLGSIAHLWVVHAPATFAIISPFTLLPPGHANTAWLIFSLAAIAALLATACKAAGLKLGSAASLWVVAFALVCTPVQLAVYHGQPALPSIACCMAAYLASLSGRQRTTGVLLAIAMCIKPHIALPVLLFIAMRRQWIGVLYTIVLFGLVSAFAGVWMADHGHTAWFANWQSNLFAATHNGDTNDYTFGNGIRFDLVQLHVPWFGILRSRAATEVAVIATTLALGASYLWLRHRMKDRDDLLDFSVLCLLCLLPFYHRWPDAAVIVPAIAWTVGKTARSKAPIAPLLALGVFVVPIAVFGSGAMKLVLMLPTAEMAERVFRILIEPFQTWSVVILLVALLAAMHNAGQSECSRDAKQLPGSLGPRPSSAFGICLALLLVLVFACAVPGDTPWICDEPMLLHNALQANEAGELVRHGLMGTQGVQYGPLPTWFYQACLAFSHNMVLLVTVRAVLVTAALAAALACIGRVAKLSEWGIPLLLFSPSIWFYSRLVWDNTFCIPLSLLAIAFYAMFLNGRRWAAGATILACGGLLLVHLMSVPLIAAIVLHAIWFRRRELLEARWAIVPALAGVGIAGARYWPVLIHGLAGGGQELHVPGWRAILFTIGGGQWLSGMGFGYLVGQEWLDGAPAALRLGLLLSDVVHLFVLGGAMVAGRHIYRVMRGRMSADRVFDLAWVCLATLLIQFVYFGVRGAVDQPHYYNASWFAYGFLAWLALDRMQRYSLGRVAGALAIALPAACVVMLMVQLHRTHGTRSLHYGPTLGDQVAVARVLTQAGPAAQVFCEVPAIAQIPQRILVLQELLGTTAPKEPASPQGVVIRFRSNDPRDGGVYAEVFPMASSTGGVSPSPTPAAATQNVPMTR